MCVILRNRGFKTASILPTYNSKAQHTVYIMLPRPPAEFPLCTRADRCRFPRQFFFVCTLTTRTEKNRTASTHCNETILLCANNSSGRGNDNSLIRASDVEILTGIQISKSGIIADGLIQVFEAHISFHQRTRAAEYLFTSYYSLPFLAGLLSTLRYRFCNSALLCRSDKGTMKQEHRRSCKHLDAILARVIVAVLS